MFSSDRLVPAVPGGNEYLILNGLSRLNGFPVSRMHSHAERGNENEARLRGVSDG